MLRYAVKCAVRCLELYEDYFGVDYPLPKCDMVALPDFAMGAMENWGLVTYREVRGGQTAATRADCPVASRVVTTLAVCVGLAGVSK